MGSKILHDGFQRYGGRLRYGIAVNPGGDGGEVHGINAVRSGKLQTAPVAGGQRRRRGVTAAGGVRDVDVRAGDERRIAAAVGGIEPLRAEGDVDLLQTRLEQLFRRVGLSILFSRFRRFSRRPGCAILLTKGGYGNV